MDQDYYDFMKSFFIHYYKSIDHSMDSFDRLNQISVEMEEAFSQARAKLNNHSYFRLPVFYFFGYFFLQDICEFV